MVRGAWPRIHPRGLADTYSRVSTYTRRRKARVEPDEPCVCATCKSREPVAIAPIARSPLLTSFFFLLRVSHRPSLPLFSPEILYRSGNSCLCETPSSNPPFIIICALNGTYSDYLLNPEKLQLWLKERVQLIYFILHLLHICNNVIYFIS